jgi:hypothetical protein
VPRWVKGDSIRILQIGYTILSKAVKFTKWGTVQLKVTAVANSRFAKNEPPVLDIDTLPFTTKHTHDDGSSHTTNLDGASGGPWHPRRSCGPTATITERTSNTGTSLRDPVRSTTATIEMIVSDTGHGLALQSLPVCLYALHTPEIVRVSRTRRHGPGILDCIAARIRIPARQHDSGRSGRGTRFDLYRALSGASRCRWSR